jgi:tRNA (guanine-N7-)-methyltransferase
VSLALAALAAPPERRSGSGLRGILDAGNILDQPAAPMAENPYTNAPRLPEGDEVPLETVVPGAGPFEIEIGSGRGGFLFERLEARSDVRMLGLEIRRKWAQIVDERLRSRGLGGRARVLAEDAREALLRITPAGSVDTFFVHFPDPWWKKRHAKRLVVGDVLLLEIARLLKAGGELYVQTDVEERALQYQEAVAQVDALVPAGDAPGSPLLAANPYGARSNREHRADADGLPVWRMRWRRR